ncbi:MAG TPA: amidohydrolase family protein [Planctomycetota bacterium]|nr:amidohydrolase family protein [Planctomycetota bacterium]
MSMLSLWIGTLLLAGGTPGAAPVATDSYAVRAKELWLDPGQRVEDGVLWVEAGKVRAAGRGVELPQGTPLLVHDGVVTAGMIAFDSALGLGGEAREPKRSVFPEGRIADVFDAADGGVADALQAGITSLVVTPSTQSLVGGRSAVVKTAHRTVLSSSAHLALGMSDAALDAGEFPTSKSGAMAELAARFEARDGAFGDAAAGRLPVLFEVGERDDVRRALKLVERFELAGVLSGARRAGDLAEPIAAAGLAVAVGPFLGGTRRRELDSVLALARAGVPLVFALEAPARHPAALRVSAAMVVRAGLDEGAAWSALTTNAAKAAGVDARVGRLAKGLDADFVLWTGDPLDLAQRPVAVFVDGARVWQGGAR